MSSKLKDRRQAAGYSQAQLVASVPGLKIKTLQAYEQGSISINKAAAETVLQISKALGCKIDDLME